MFYDNVMTSTVGITDVLNGIDGVRTVVLRAPAAFTAWAAPRRRLSEAAVAGVPSAVIGIAPALRTPFAHQMSFGIDRDISSALSLSADLMYVRGFHQPGTIDYNPILPDLGAGRRPEDVNGVAGTSSIVQQITSFGETWYRGLVVSVTKRFSQSHELSASYTLSKAEDTSTDFQGFFLPQDNGRGRNPSDPNGLPIGFVPAAERGPSVRDQRHRLTLHGLWTPRGVLVSSIVTLGSGRPYNILAGVDLNGDGDGGSPPVDRARRVPSDASSSLTRNAGTMPWQATMDVRVSKRFRVGGRMFAEAMVEAFNLFDRTNYTEINNTFRIGAYPSSPLATYGQFEQTGPPRQAQIGPKLGF